jgi:hypothetical protein
MSIITFKDFARDFTRLCTADFKAASDRYFRYRGMDENMEMVEKHFIHFLHFLDLEEIFQSYALSSSMSSGIDKLIDTNVQKSGEVGICSESHSYSTPTPIVLSASL